MRPALPIKLFSLCMPLFFSPALLAADPIWIDVRTLDEYNDGHVAAAVNIPYTEIAKAIPALTTNKEAVIYVYCRSGRRSGIAQKTLLSLGYSQVINLGGLDDAMKKFTQEPAAEPVQ